MFPITSRFHYTRFLWLSFAFISPFFGLHTLCASVHTSEAAYSEFIHAQSRASYNKIQLHGRVVDEDGEGIPRAHVRLSDLIGTITDSLGNYSLAGIQPNRYTITISAIGYETYERTVEIIVNDKIYMETILKSLAYESETVVITASRTKELLNEVSVPMIVVPKKEIQQNGNVRLSDVLSEQLGLYLVEDHGTGLQLQGFDPEYTLILIDNQPLIGRTAGTLDLTRLSVGNIEQIELVKGPSSALWGSDALAGVINIITDKGSKPFEWGLNSRYATHHTRDVSGHFNLKKNNLQSRFYGNLNGSSGYDLNPSTITPTIPEYLNYTLQGGATYSFEPGLSLDISGRYYREDQKYPDVILNRRVERQAQGDEFQQDYFISSALRYAVGSVHLVEAQAYIGFFQSQSTLKYQDTGERYFSDRFSQRLNNFEFKASTFWNTQHTTILGAGVKNESLDAEIYAEVPLFTSTFMYGQHDWEPSNDYSLTIGFRYDTHSEYNSQLSPKLSTRWSINPTFTLKASFGGGYKAPDFRQLFLNFSNPISGYSVYGTSTLLQGLEQLQATGQLAELFIAPDELVDIEAEQSLALNLGFDWSLSDAITLRFNSFRNHVNNLIETQRIALKTNNQSVFSYVNIQQMYSQGMDIDAQFEVPWVKGLRWTTGVQLLDTRQRIREQFDDVVNGLVTQKVIYRFVPMFNRSTFTGLSKFYYEAPNRGWDINIRTQYRGPYGFVDINGNNRIDDREKVEGYIIVNSSVGKAFKEAYRIQFNISNLTNRTDPLRMPSNPGRVISLQLSMNF
jgi:outer membrane receptor for ferrienterochelin and colicins